jgi:phosphohistidine phosphatase SixA
MKISLCLAISLVLATPARAQESPGAAWAALKSGAIVLFRHADAPGVGDPPGFALGDCASQRNLGAAGKEQAVALGVKVRQAGVKVGQVWASQWCRTLETARLMALGPVLEQAPFNSFFAGRENEPAQTKASLALLASIKGPGSTVVVTHQVNVTALTGVYLGSGEGVVVRLRDGRLQVIGKI